MAYSRSNECSKCFCKRTILVQVIIENVVTCFWSQLELSCNVLEIYRIIGRKSLHFYTPPVFSAPERGDSVGISRRFS